MYGPAEGQQACRAMLLLHGGSMYDSLFARVMSDEVVKGGYGVGLK